MKEKRIILLCRNLFLFSILGLFLSACQHTTANSNNSNNQVNQSSDMNPVRAFSSSNLATRGAILGAAGGAATSVASGGSLLPMTVGGAIIGAGYGAILDRQASSTERLQNRGVQMVRIGDDLLFVLPSDILFSGDTAVLNSGAIPLLDRVAKYIAQYSHVGIRVIAYRNVNVSSSAALALSQMQARTVAKFLWAHGVDTRLLYASGQGSTHFVVPVEPDDAGNLNNRVEITLQVLPNL